MNFGLIGKSLTHSFSSAYFLKKFKDENITAVYSNYELPKLTNIHVLFEKHNLKGINVTIPYKQEIIPFLDQLDPLAKAIGAVNTVKLTHGKLIGFNTDVIGFVNSLAPMLPSNNLQALVLGNGGAAQAIKLGLEQLEIPFKIVSRNPKNQELSYHNLSPNIIDSHKLIINTTPLGTYPKVNDAPSIPYHLITKNHLAYDLVYNPEESQFLTNCKTQGARIKNGLEMLKLQAEASWEIWNA